MISKSQLSTKTNKTRTTAPRKIPRLVSLLHRLKRAKDPKGKPLPFLDELMLFLDDPPSGTLDRWKQGAEMCRGWGFETSGASVYRLYNSHLALWRMEMAEEAMPDAEDLPAYRERAARLTALRTVETLAHSRLAPEHLIGLARLEVRRQSLELARKKFELLSETKMEMALDALAEEIDKSSGARAAFENLRLLLTKKEEEPLDPQPKAPSVVPAESPTSPPHAPIYPRRPRAQVQSGNEEKSPLHPPDPPHPADPLVFSSSHSQVGLGNEGENQPLQSSAVLRAKPCLPGPSIGTSTATTDSLSPAEQPSGADNGRSPVQLGNKEVEGSRDNVFLLNPKTAA